MPEAMLPATEGGRERNEGVPNKACVGAGLGR